jgi:hypothetical protein
MNPITAEQITDVDTWTVQVHADPTPELLTKLCHDLDRCSGLRALVSHLTPDNPEHQRALAELAIILADTFTWTLTATQADEIGGQFYEAGISPEQCCYDEKFAVTLIGGVPMCHGHAAAHDRMVEEQVKA